MMKRIMIGRRRYDRALMLIDRVLGFLNRRRFSVDEIFEGKLTFQGMIEDHFHFYFQWVYLN
jgi:hypothetical protein